MTDLQLVRTIISDKPMHSIARARGNGANTEFKFPYAPIYPSTGKVRVNSVLKVLTNDYSIDEALGLVTFIVAPTAGLEVAITASVTMLTDEEITALLGQYADSDNAVKLAAADSMDIIASSEAMISKKIKILDLQTDGAAIADSLRKHADSLRKQVFSQDMVEPSFNIAEQINDRPGFDEKILKDFMRET